MISTVNTANAILSQRHLNPDFHGTKEKDSHATSEGRVDADLLLDLAGSLLAAQAQAGWHELRLKNIGALDLISNGSVRP